MSRIRVRRTFEIETTIDPAHWPSYTVAELMQQERELTSEEAASEVDVWDLKQTDVKVWLDSEGS